MRIKGAGNDAIALHPGVSMGARDPYGVLIRQIGTSRLFGFWHAAKNVATSGSNLVSWDDVRGASGFGPTMLPNGGLGGTPPTVSAGTINTDGSSSFVTHASAQTALALKLNALTWIFWGEVTGTPSYWGGLMDGVTTGSDFQILQPNGGGTMDLYNLGAASPKVQPGAGVRSLWIVSREGKYPWDLTNYYGSQKFEWVGRGAVLFPSGADEHTATSGYLCLGRVYSYYGVVKLRGMIAISGAALPSDRAAIEAFVTDPTIGDGVSLYGASDSTGMVMCIGDSLTAGSGASSTSTTTPVSPSATSYPSVLQSLINAASKKLDTVNWGLGSRTLNEFVTVQAGCTTSYLNACAAMLSPGRRAAGKKEVVSLWMGTNDINGGRSAAQLEGDITTAVAAIKAAGGKVSICTIIPRTGWYGSATETTRLAVNTWIRANSVGADLVIDLALVNNSGTFFLADPSGGSDTITTNATYYNADGTHQTDLGYSKIANYIYTALVGASLI